MRAIRHESSNPRHPKVLGFFVFMHFLMLVAASGQTDADLSGPLDRVVEISVSDGLSTEEALRRLAANAGVVFSYSNRIYRSRSVVFSRHRQTLRAFLDELFRRNPVEYVVRGNKIILRPINDINVYVISGYCRDSISGEVLIGATVGDLSTQRGTSSNEYGFYSFSIPAGDVDVLCSFVGYRTQHRRFTIESDTVLDFTMTSALKLPDIDVYSDDSDETFKSSRTGTVNLPIEQIKSAPSLLGESDVIKSLQLIPGVQSGQEGFGGMIVRGGGRDQNMVLLDDVPIYNSHHLLGLFSIFNSESVNDVTLVKSGFPARYGGRLSSVLDVKMREGNSSEYHGTVNIGLLASGVLLEGPVVQKRSSFIVSARRTYFDLFSSPMQLSRDRRMSYYFYDVNTKLNYILSSKDRLYLSFFAGYDKFSVDYNERSSTIVYGNGLTKDVNLSDNIGMNWGNIVASARWNHVYGSRLFSNTTLYFSKFRFNVDMERNNYADDAYSSFTHIYYSGIRDFGVRTDYTLFPSKSVGVVRFGANATFHTFFPGINVMTETNLETAVDTTVGRSNLYRSEFHGYVEDDQPIGESVKLCAGIHFSALSRSGHRLYCNVEPRLLLSTFLTKNISVKFGYSSMTQYLHLVRIGSVSTPADLWLPVMDNIDPIHSQQTALETDFGLLKDFGLTVEVYRKWMNNILTYTNISNGIISIDTDWYSNLSSGKGNSYGLELLLHKKTGQLSGWLGYSWSRSRVEFPDVNDGKPFPSDNDRTHSLALLGFYKIRSNIEAVASWTYGTGTPISIADTKYQIPLLPTSSDKESVKQLIQSRNAYRMPDSHTLNVGVNFTKEFKWGHRVLSIGVYNVYARKNPLFVYVNNSKNDDGTTETTLKQFSLVAWPWPYFKYIITF